MRLYCTAEVKPEEIMTRKDKDNDKEGHWAVHKGFFQKCKNTKWQKIFIRKSPKDIKLPARKGGGCYKPTSSVSHLKFKMNWMQASDRPPEGDLLTKCNPL